LCAGSGLDTARTVVKTGRARAGLGAARGGAPTRILSLSAHLPESSAGTGSVARIPLASPSLKTSFPPYRNYVRGKTLSANRCLANSYTPTSSPTPSDNQNHPHAIMFGVISSPHKPLSAPSRIKRVRSLASTASSRRTGRIFRDEEELHTSHDLTQSIRNALRDSTLHRRRTKTLRH